MNVQQSQIKLNLPVPMKQYLESKADKFGMPLAGYIKHLILKDIADMDYPIVQASEQTEDAYKKAVKDHKEGKTIKVKNTNAFFDEL